MVTSTTASCLARLRAGIQGGSSALTRIGRFVLKSPFQARDLSIGELAQAWGASAATVHRICRDLGYDGYEEGPRSRHAPEPARG
jgi:DNA-binding MurR/RpiR family transcriptional regulator